MLCDALRERLDPRSGVVLKAAQNDNKYWQTAFDAVWKGRIHFIVVESLFRRNFGHYYVMRDEQYISPCFAYTRIDEQLFNILQSMIDDIENGRYDNKKTLRERIKSFAAQNGLVSYMNNTKWRELFDGIGKKMPDILLQYKLLFDENAPVDLWVYSADEELPHIDLARIEWLKLRHTVTEYKHIGNLLPPEEKTYDKKDEILEILHRSNIPYEYIENEQAFIIYGYKK